MLTTGLQLQTYMSELPKGFVADHGELRNTMVTIPDEVPSPAHPLVIILDAIGSSDTPRWTRLVL